MGKYKSHPLNTALSKPILQIDISTGEAIAEYPSIAEAGRKGFTRGNINKVLAGRRNHANGFYWKYK